MVAVVHDVVRMVVVGLPQRSVRCAGTASQQHREVNRSLHDARVSTSWSRDHWVAWCHSHAGQRGLLVQRHLKRCHASARAPNSTVYRQIGASPWHVGTVRQHTV